MSKRIPANLRNRCQWLVVGLTTSIIATTIIGSLLGAPGAVSRSAAKAGDSHDFWASATGPQQCAICHDQQFFAWAGTAHAQASFNPSFQVKLKQTAEPSQCLPCHTTGYNLVSGRFSSAGVTCEACHGPYHPEHPAESMAIATSAELCGACHSTTLDEWRDSKHGQVGVSCAACHEVHSQKPRVATSSDSLCLLCHQREKLGSAHAGYGFPAQEKLCVDCHLAHPVAQVVMAGGSPTGHTFMAGIPSSGKD
ncbi:MAG: multiheme c-type cytochrome [Chloroflexota bacterium]|nr:multiheme c-type cytochrome [Chloroflexota bacterium]